MSPEDLADLIAARLPLALPNARVERAVNAPSVWVYTPNGDIFRIVVEQLTAPQGSFWQDSWQAQQRNLD